MPETDQHDQVLLSGEQVKALKLVLDKLTSLGSSGQYEIIGNIKRGIRFPVTGVGFVSDSEILVPRPATREQLFKAISDIVSPDAQDCQVYSLDHRAMGLEDTDARMYTWKSLVQGREFQISPVTTQDKMVWKIGSTP
jgi:hypothetical protein